MLALIVLGLGTWGFLRYYHSVPPPPERQDLRNTHFDLTDAVYRALQLFGFGGSVEPPIPWQLVIARTLGPLLVGYGVVRGLVAIWREQISFLAFRHLLRGHVVVAGLGTAGFSIATTLHDAGFRVVTIEHDSSNPKIPGCRDRGIGVLEGDAADPSLLRTAGIRRARYLIVTCGDDGTNVNAAYAARALVEGRPGGALTTYVELDDLDLWRMMKKKALADPPEPACRLEFFNVFAIGARLLLEQFPPFDRESREAHVLVVGLDGVGESLVLHTAWLWQSAHRGPGAALVITIAGPSAPAKCEKLVARHPRIQEICELRAQELELDWSQFDRRELAMGASAIYVSLASETDAIAATLALRAHSDARTVPVVVALADQDAGIASALGARPSGEMAVGRGGYENIHAFGVLSRTLTSELLVHGTNEILARELHEDYLRERLADGKKVGDKPSRQPWQQLPEYYKETNRSAAADIGRKLEEIGCVIVPDPLVDPGGCFAYSESELQKLERLEHERWWAERERDNWKLGPQDDEKKTSPYLVPWEDLDRDIQEYDRQQVENYPRILALTGFRIDRVQPVTVDRGSPQRSTEARAPASEAPAGS